MLSIIHCCCISLSFLHCWLPCHWHLESMLKRSVMGGGDLAHLDSSFLFIGTCCQTWAIMDHCHCHSSVVVCLVTIGDVAPASCVNKGEGRGVILLTCPLSVIVLCHSSSSCVIVVYPLWVVTLPARGGGYWWWRWHSEGGCGGWWSWLRKCLFVDEGYVMFLANDLLYNTDSCQQYVIVTHVAQFIWRSKLWQDGTTSIIPATVGHTFMSHHTFVIFLMSPPWRYLPSLSWATSHSPICIAHCFDAIIQPLCALHLVSHNPGLARVHQQMSNCTLET